MKVVFDTSVAVAALLGAHPFHARAMCWVKAAGTRQLQAHIAWHGLAESWAVLTRLPGASVPAPVAERLIGRLAERIRPIAMTAGIYRAALRRCADRDVRSGSIFDALHIAAAEHARAEVLLTFNPDDFLRLAPGGAPRVAVPPDPPSLRIPR